MTIYNKNNTFIINTKGNKFKFIQNTKQKETRKKKQSHV